MQRRRLRMWVHVWLGPGRSGPGWWILALLCLAILAVAIILAVWKLPSLLYGDVSKASPDARLQAASNFRTAFVAGLAGLAALGSLTIANRTYRLTQQGQITDRYTKAIEQLGGDKLDVRLGGIYALERIATDSERDHPTVVEVLSAFVREHSQPSTVDDDNVGDDNGGPLAPPPEPVKKVPTTDVQAAVTVLGRLPQRRHVSRGNLDGAYLEGANLQEAHLEGAHMLGAHLEGANLDESYLRRRFWSGRTWKGHTSSSHTWRGCTWRGRPWRGRTWAEPS